MRKWKTKDGRLIPLNELGDRHLSNIISMVAGQFRSWLHTWSWRAFCYADDAPDGAADCAEREANAMQELAIAPLGELAEGARYTKEWTILWDLWQEQERRDKTARSKG